MRIIDISQGWRVGMPKYNADWYPEFSVDHVMTPRTDPAGVDRTFTYLHLFAHNGSHVESGLHFYPGGAEIGSFPLDRFIGPACVADLSHRGDLDPVTGDMLDKAVGSSLRPGMRLLIRTDHPVRHLDNHDYWDTPPYLEESAAAWIVERQVSVVGMDCITEKPGDRAFPIHRALLRHEIPILENLANLHAVSDTVVWLFAAPLKITGVEAAPCRAVVIEGMPR
ncbi:cyclase family protein [Actinomadura terrae]|uniref:cyclase family protein n=1 Tax=Actinomadura terrae TaxID=604353 RepID=UPI001FA7722D|nr:cyclase family protein [Actinomadura terrae]